MKKLSLFILLLMPVLGFADNGVTKENALEIANKFLGKSGLVDKNQIIQVEFENQNITKNRPLHIFSDKNGGGFVIISNNDDKQFDILGYSETGNSSNIGLPPQLQEILNNFTSSKQKSVFKTPQRAETNKEVLLKTAQWGQGFPYNTECPVIDGANAPTGCVATAMAIIMKYHSWPDEYLWDNMPLESVDSENYDLSSLMAEIGEKVGMNYSTLDSEAYSGLISQTMFADFGFSHQAQMISIGEGNHINQDDWNKFVIEELDNGRPVIYLGTGIGSHAFIVDGYNADGLFHINWGWDGAFNGYFDLNQLMPYDGAYFSNQQGMVMSLMPGDESDKQYSPTAYMDYGYLVGLECMHGFGVNPDVTTIEKEVPFNVTFGTLNVRPNTWFGISLMDENNNIKEVLYSEHCAANKADDDSGFIHYVGSNIVKITSDIDDNDKIQIIAKEKESSPWLLVRGTSETPSYQALDNINSRVTTLNWSVPEGVETKYRIENSEFNGTLNHVAKGSLFEVYAYSKKQGYLVISLNGKDSASQDISLWEYGKIGATNSIVCIGDVVDIDVKFIPESEYEDLSINLSEPGTLEQVLTGKDLPKIISLTIKGKMDYRDFLYLRNNLSKISSLDISEVSIEAYDNFKQNYLPDHALESLNRLKQLYLPQIEVIGANALFGLNSLFELTIPPTVKEIGDYAFSECNNLKRIVFKNDIPFKGSANVFPGHILNYSFIVVPEGAKQAYENTEYSERFGRILEGDLVPAKSIKIVNGDYNTEAPIPIAFAQALNFGIILEPENSTDYIISAVPEENRYLDIYYNSDNINLNVSHFIEDEREEVFFLKTSSGVSAEYKMLTIPPIKTFTLQKEIEMKENDCIKLDYELYPSSYKIIFTSKDPDIASVNNEGEIMALKAGETVITATAQDAVREYSAQCKVKVSDLNSLPELLGADETCIKIFNLNGSCIGTFSSLQNLRISPGFYIVKQGGKVRKVFIGINK